MHHINQDLRMITWISRYKNKTRALWGWKLIENKHNKSYQNFTDYCKSNLKVKFVIITSQPNICGKSERFSKNKIKNYKVTGKKLWRWSVGIKQFFRKRKIFVRKTKLSNGR